MSDEPYLNWSKGFVHGLCYASARLTWCLDNLGCLSLSTFWRMHLRKCLKGVLRNLNMHFFSQIEWFDLLLSIPLPNRMSSHEQLPKVADTWAQFEDLIYSNNPTNFLLGGECARVFDKGNFDYPSLPELVDALRRMPNTRILPGRTPRRKNSTPFSSLETTSAGHHLNAPLGDEESFAAKFRSLPLDEALLQPFSMALFELEPLMAKGGLLEGWDSKVLNRWRESLRDAGWEFDRCYPILFISGPNDIGSFHHDVSHVVAVQLHGCKRFCGFREPRRWHTLAERCKLGSTVVMPNGLCEDDVLAVHMTPDSNSVLMNQLLTPHWVQNPNSGSASASLNISHGGLRYRARSLCQHERELEEFKASNPDAAAMFDVKKGWRMRDDPTKEKMSETEGSTLQSAKRLKS